MFIKDTYPHHRWSSLCAVIKRIFLALLFPAFLFLLPPAVNHQGERGRTLGLKDSFSCPTIAVLTIFYFKIFSKSGPQGCLALWHNYWHNLGGGSMKVVSLDTDSALPPSPPSPTPSEDSVRLETTKTFPDVPPVVPLGDSLFPLCGDLAV